MNIGNKSVLSDSTPHKLSLKDRIYYAIVADIVSGSYSPNAILNEKNLVERFGVSKSPVRDALVGLCSDGILRSIPRVGYEVVPLTEQDMREIVELRYYVESQCLLKVIDSISTAQLAELQQFVATSELWAQDQRDITEHWKNNIDFHLLLVSFSCNRFIYDMLERTMNTQLRGYAQFYWDRWHQSMVRLDMSGHKKLVSAIAGKDTELALQCLKVDLGLLGG